MDYGFVWDEKKYELVKKKHNVRLFEVVAAFEDEAGYETDDPEFEDRFIWVGRTIGGRVLFVVSSEEDLPLYRIITAFEAEGRWLNEYNR